MVRPQILAGELGAIDARRLASGRCHARSSIRDDSGAPRRPTVTAAIEDAMHAEVIRQAMARATGGSRTLSPSSTVADAVELWLSQVLSRAKAGSLAYSTSESSDTTARVIIVPRCGGVRLKHLTVGRCDRVLQRVLDVGTISKARRSRTVLCLVCGYAVRDDAMRQTRVRDVQCLPTSTKKESALTSEQIKAVRALMQLWRITRDDGPRPNYRALIKLVAGITLASRLLGHANEQTTRNSYVVTADMVDPVTAEILDAVLGS